MHDIANAVLLGIIEGLTEFLPVSSTAHLLLAEKFLASRSTGEVFDIVIQFGAILAVVAVYWRKFWDVAMGLPRDAKARHFTLGIGIAFIPAAVAGVLLHRYITQVLWNPVVIAIAFILGGIIILIIERIKPPVRHDDSDNLPFLQCLEIGLCQCLALIPGVSRSGATILGGMMFGVERKAAAEFTFYLAVPTMLGASVFDLYKNWATLTFGGAELIAIGFAVSFAAAYAVVQTFIAFISRYGFAPFAYYRIAVGLVVLALLYG